MANFSKFDLQSIINNVKSMIGGEAGTPKVPEGDPIGQKIVEISTLVQNAGNAQAQSAKDLNKVNELLNGLYKDLEFFKKLEQELKEKEQAIATAEATKSAQTNVPPSSSTTTIPEEKETNLGQPTSSTKADIKPKQEEEFKAKIESGKSIKEE